MTLLVTLIKMHEETEISLLVPSAPINVKGITLIKFEILMSGLFLLKKLRVLGGNRGQDLPDFNI